MIWSHNDNWMVTGDDGGAIKYDIATLQIYYSYLLFLYSLFCMFTSGKKLRYWQSNMNNVKVNKTAHKESVRDLRYVMFLNVHKFMFTQMVFILLELICVQQFLSNRFEILFLL